MKNFLLCFVLFFVVVDVIGVLPIYLGLTEGFGLDRKKKIIIQFLIMVLIVGIAFLLGGFWMLRLVGVGVFDFMVVGGILFLVLLLSDLIIGEKRRRVVDSDSIGVVPIGVLLIIGLVVLIVSILLVNEYGIMPIVLVLILNIVIVGIVFFMVFLIERFLG